MSAVPERCIFCIPWATALTVRTGRFDRVVIDAIAADTVAAHPEAASAVKLLLSLLRTDDIYGLVWMAAGRDIPPEAISRAPLVCC